MELFPFVILNGCPKKSINRHPNGGGVNQDPEDDSQPTALIAQVVEGPLQER